MTYSEEQFAQLAKPHGDKGVSMLAHLNRVNVNINSMALDALGEDAGSEILEIGFGGGALISDGLNRFREARFWGAEVSDVAIEQAQSAFADQIRQERLLLCHYDGGSLPLADATFDAVIAVNVIYFLSDIPSFLCDLRRLLNSRGRCVLAYAEGSPDRVTRFTNSDMENALISAGFDQTSTLSAKDTENGIFHCTTGYVRR